MTIHQTIDIPEDRKIYLELPETAPMGRTEVILEFKSPVQTEKPLEPQIPEYDPSVPRKPHYLYPLDHREAINAIAWNYGRLDDSSRKYAGCLKGKGIFKGDPVEIQRKMRDEW